MPVLIVSEKTWPPGRLLEEALDASVLVGDDDPELERVLDRLQADRDRGLALLVEGDELAEVDVAERVARDDEEGVVELVGGQRHRAGGAERRLLDRVLDLHPQRLAVAEVAADRLRQERDRDDDVLEAVLAQELEDVLHARLADDRHHRLRLVGRERPQACALPTCHDDGLHFRTSRLALRRYWTSVTAARPKPIQKMTIGHSAPLCVTITKPSEAYRNHVATLPRKVTSKS